MSQTRHYNNSLLLYQELIVAVLCRVFFTAAALALYICIYTHTPRRRSQARYSRSLRVSTLVVVARESFALTNAIGIVATINVSCISLAASKASSSFSHYIYTVFLPLICTHPPMNNIEVICVTRSMCTKLPRLYILTPDLSFFFSSFCDMPEAIYG